MVGRHGGPGSSSLTNRRGMMARQSESAGVKNLQKKKKKSAWLINGALSKCQIHPFFFFIFPFFDIDILYPEGQAALLFTFRQI